MSPTIWTQCGRKTSLRRLSGRPWRAVEAQHVFSTAKLVDSDDEQRLLEDLLEQRAKPPRPHDARPGLHYLLYTPFRYPSLPGGSRFAPPTERALWYGSEHVETALAEKAYWLLVFLEGTTAELGPVTRPITVFQAAFRTVAGVDLTRAPFDEYQDDLRSPTSYAAAQALGREMRSNGVEAFRYASARDPAGRANFGLFTPAVFSCDQPLASQTWHSETFRGRVSLIRRHGLRIRQRLLFTREQYLIDGRLPMPGIG